jgi:hypothetical protein
VNAKKLRPSYQPFEENSSLEKEPGENVRKFGLLSSSGLMALLVHSIETFPLLLWL